MVEWGVLQLSGVVLRLSRVVLRRVAVVGAVGLAVAAGACGSTGASRGGASTTSAPAGSVPPAAVVRGSPVGSLACPAPSSGGAVPASVSVPADRITTIVLCPLLGSSDAPSTVTIARGDARLAPLVAALSVADKPSPPGQQVCAAYADAVQVVLAATPSGDLRVHVPVDGCGHYLPSVLRLLSADRSA